MGSVVLFVGYGAMRHVSNQWRPLGARGTQICKWFFAGIATVGSILAYGIAKYFRIT